MESLSTKQSECFSGRHALKKRVLLGTQASTSLRLERFGSILTSCPLVNTEPCVGVISPLSILRSNDFPDLFKPSMTNTSPSSTSSDTPRTARFGTSVCLSCRVFCSGTLKCVAESSTETTNPTKEQAREQTEHIAVWRKINFPRIATDNWDSMAAAILYLRDRHSFMLYICILNLPGVIKPVVQHQSAVNRTDSVPPQRKMFP